MWLCGEGRLEALDALLKLIHGQGVRQAHETGRAERFARNCDHQLFVKQIRRQLAS